MVFAILDYFATHESISLTNAREPIDNHFEIYTNKSLNFCFFIPIRLSSPTAIPNILNGTDWKFRSAKTSASVTYSILSKCLL